MLNRWLSVSTLQKSIQKTNPALSRDSLGKLTFCHKKSKNLLDSLRPKGHLIQVDLDGQDSQWWSLLQCTLWGTIWDFHIRISVAREQSTGIIYITVLRFTPEEAQWAKVLESWNITRYEHTFLSRYHTVIYGTTMTAAFRLEGRHSITRSPSSRPRSPLT